MNPPKFRIVDQEELVALLDEICNAGDDFSPEELAARFRRVCRVVYGVTRYAIASKIPAMADLVDTAVGNLERGNINGASAALIFKSIALYLNVKIDQNREQFKTEFIQAVDDAVLSTAKFLEEQNDTSTKQSASQRPAEPYSTS